MHCASVFVSRQNSSAHWFLAFFAALISLLPLSTIAQDTKTDNDSVLLTIHGNIESTETSIELDLKTLTEMESTMVTTDLPWTDGPEQYTGVRISKLLDYVGAKSNHFEALAINDYQFTLTDIDFDQYPILIAYQKNNQLLTIRELGPLMIIFPFDDYPELLTERNKAASVWQLIEMIVL